MSEWSAVQNPMLEYAEQIGWERVSPQEMTKRRGGIGGSLLPDVLTAQLHALNPGMMNDERAAEIIRRLRILPASIEGNREALAWMRGEKTIFVTEEHRERGVTLIDFDAPANNVFQVTWEWRHQSPSFPIPNRADVVFLINGLPVAVAELKAAGKPNGAAEGVEQIRRYHRETPEMMTLAQVFEVSQMLDFYYGATWNTTRKNLMNWRDDEPGNYERKVKAFFDHSRFLAVLKEYVLFLSKDDQLSKVILRQHQVRAVEKVVARAADAHKRRGLIWHTQGSGKTLTMITIASKLLRGTINGEKPTILMLVDRTELEDNLFKDISAFGFDGAVTARSKADLQNMLRQDRRGLIVSMIHKFDDIPADLNTRGGIVILVDEAHRTTGGDLGNYLMAALPNATYIGFTGTPIDDIGRGKGTFKTFGTDDLQGYLDKYSIAESINDGTTVKLNYALAPQSLRLDRETLDQQFLRLTEAEGMADVEELNALLDKSVALKEMMKNPTRMDGIARFVAKHFRENVEPMGFKGFLVAVDREACALYKEALDKYLPPYYSQVVMSVMNSDKAALKQHRLDEDAEKRVRRDFVAKDKLPKILIVTEKLLTGFDAPILYALYLDKPMRDHVLLQTIARVNRPYEDDSGIVKPYGFVLDFVGIFERLEAALAFDSDVVTSVIQNIDVLKNLFVRMMTEEAIKYLSYAGGVTDKEKERAIAHFDDRDERERFFKFFKQIEALYDILSPDAFLRPYMDDYLALAELYVLVRDAFAARIYVDKEVTAKTKTLLRTSTSSGAVELPGKIHSLGAEELAALKHSENSEITKILNLRKALAVTVDIGQGAKPFVVSIGERAEALIAAYEDRQKTTHEVLEAFEKLTQEYVDADSERGHLGLGENAFTIYAALRPINNAVTVTQAQSIDALFVQFPDYAWDADLERQMRGALYKQLRPIVGNSTIDAATTLMKLRRI